MKIVMQNGNDGRVYLIEQIARCMAGDFADQKLMGKNAGKKRWQIHVPTAIKILDIVEEFQNG